MVLFFIVKFLLILFAAASLQTALILCHRSDPDGSYKGELHLIPVKKSTRRPATKKICNNGPSCRVGEASRAHPKGLARLPNIYLSVMYQADPYPFEIDVNHSEAYLTGVPSGKFNRAIP